MADIRLNLIADLGAFQGALASAVTQAKSTVAPVKVTATIDRDVWKRSLIDAKTLLGTYLKTYKTTIQLDTAKANTQIIALKNKLETDIGGLVLEPIVKPIIDFTDINKLKKEVASVATKPAGASRGETVADLLGKTKGEGGVNIGAIKAIAKELGVTGSSGQELRKALQDLFRAAGEDSIAGLEEGLKNAYATGTTAAKDFSDGFKDALGIASPAKLFKQFGEFCVAGIANGLLKIDAAAKNAAKDFGYNFETQLDREIQEVGIEKYANQLGKRFGEAFGDSVGITIRGSIDAALSTVMVKGGLAAILGGGKAAIGALPSAAGETGGIAVKTAGLVAQLIKDAFLAGPEELGRNLVANVQAIVSSDSGSIAAALGKITTAFVSGALDAGIEAIRANPQAIGQAAVAGAIAGTGAVVLKRAVPALYDSLVNAIARKVASDIQFTIQAIRNPQQAFAGIQLAIGQVQVSIGYLVQAERRLAGVTIQYGQTAYQLSSELGQSAAGLLKGVAGFLRSTELVVAALRSGQVGLLGAAQALVVFEDLRRQPLPSVSAYNDERLLGAGRQPQAFNRAELFNAVFAQVLNTMSQGFGNFGGFGGGGGRKPPFILPFGEDPNQYGGPIGPASKYPYVSARQFNLPGRRRQAAEAAMSVIGVSPDQRGVSDQKRALAQLQAAYRNGTVSAKEFARAQLQVQKATLDSILPFKGLTNSLKDLGSQFAEAGKDILFYGAAYQALGMIQQLPRNIYDAVKAQDSFSNTLKASIGVGDTYGQQLQFLTQLSAKYGMNLAKTRDGFVKMFTSLRQANVATGDVNRLQESVAILGTAFKMSPDKLDRVTYALGQMASKGQITSEELKGQLGDVLPGAVAQFAEAAGYKGPDAIAKFSKAMEDGAFKGKAMQDVMYNWAIIVNRDFANAAKNGQNSIQGFENQLANANTRVLESFRGGIAQVMPAIVTPLIGGLNQVADALDVIFKNSAQRQSQLLKNQSQLETAIKTGVAPADNLELGFRAGRAVDTTKANQQLKQTQQELGFVNQKLNELAGNQSVQKLANDLLDLAKTVTGFFNGLKTGLSPLTNALSLFGEIASAVSGVGKTVGELTGAFIALILQVRLVSGLMFALKGFFLGAGGASTTAAGGVTAFTTAIMGLVRRLPQILALTAIFETFMQIKRGIDLASASISDFKSSIKGMSSAGLEAQLVQARMTTGQRKRELQEAAGAAANPLAQMTPGLNAIVMMRYQNAKRAYDQAANEQASIQRELGAAQRREATQQPEPQMRQITPGGDGESEKGKGRGKGKGAGTAQAIGDDFVSLMQKIQSDTLKAALEEQKYVFEGAIARLFPRGAGIFQPFVDAYKGVFDFLNDFQERQMQQMESATKTMVSGFRLSERDRANQARLTKNAVVTQRNDPDAEKTGSDISIPGGVGAQIRNPFENMVIKSRGTQGGGSGATGRGYGNYITGEVVIGGKRYEVLLGHMDKINVNVGDALGAGGLIGTQGISGRATGPHVTTHVNPLGGGSVADAQRVLGMIEGAWQKGQVIPSGVSAGTGLSATTLTAQQQAQIKEAEKALAEQQKRTTAAMLQGRMQDVFNLFEEANLGDKLSKVSVALRELQRRTEDFGFRAKEAFAEFLPEGAREARKAILSAQKDLADARRETEDIRLEFEQMAKQGGAIDQLFAGGIEALKDPQYKDVVSRINAMLAAAGKGTLEQAFIAAKGSATELRKILEGLGIDIEASAARLEAAALITEKLAIARAPFLEQDAALARQGSILGMMGISTGVIESQRKQLDIQKRLAEIRIQMQANPGEASAYQQEVVDLQRMLFLSQNIQGTFITIGELFGQLNDSFRGFFNDLGTGFAEAITNGTSMFDALTSAASNFFMAIGKYLVDLAAQQAAAGILGFIGNLFGFGSSFGSTSFGSFDLLGGAGGGFGSFAGSTTGSFGITPNLGGFNPGLALPGFANGGLVDAPTVALIGEGRYNEAVVPLPDGRSIPVQLNDPFSENREKLIQSTKEAASQGAFDVANELFSTNKSAMQRYGLAGSKPIQSNSSSANTTITNQSGGGISMSFNTTRIYNEEFVRVEDLQAALKATRQQSVNEATRTTFDRLRNSPGTRRSVGI